MGISTMLMHALESGGYVATFMLMMLESACIPIPSEVVMPFAGYLAWEGHLHLWVVIVAGMLGNVVGSLIAYYIGKFGGRPIILRYGRYVHISERTLHTTEAWFEKRGEWAVLIGRLLPGIRTFISLPAGIADMSIGRFVVFTTIGSLPWVAILAYGGYSLGQNWEHVKSYIHPLLYVVVIATGVAVAVAWYQYTKKRKQSSSV